MRFDASSVLLLSLPARGLCRDDVDPRNAVDGIVLVAGDESSGRTHQYDGRRRRNLQTSSCLAASNFDAASFTTIDDDTCAPDLVRDVVSAAMASNAGCNATSLTSELASLLGLPEGSIDADLDAALRGRCDAAFRASAVEFRKITRRGDAFDREFFAGGSDWNDQYQVDVGGRVRHVLGEDASGIPLRDSDSAGVRPIGFPSYLPTFRNCDLGAAMCCYVSDRQANDAGGSCEGDDSGASDCGCADADPEGNTDVCVASMADATVSNRVKRGLAVYHLNDRVEAAEGDVNCLGLAWDSTDVGSHYRYRGNVLFDLSFKQSLYDRGYVKNIPGAPMCGCIEQMPTVTRADCTKITSIFETYTLSINDVGLLELKLSDADVQYGPCGSDEDLSSHYKQVNAANTPDAIDTKLVGEGNCLRAIDASMGTYGYRRSVLEVREAFLAPSDVSPPRLRVHFNVAAADGAAGVDSFKVRDVANSAAELAVSSASMKQGDTVVELELSSAPVPGTTYSVSNIVRLHKKVAPMVTLEPGVVSRTVATASWDHIQIGNWRLARTCETCSMSHLSISSDNAVTSQIFRDTGSTYPGPRSDYNGWEDVDSHTGPTYSVEGVTFGDYAVQIRDWRIRQIDPTHLSVTHNNGNVARIYRSDGTVHGMVNGFSGYIKPLGEPSCAYLAATYLQIGDWRFGAYDAHHLSVAHRLGMTSVIYRTDGNVHPGPRRDYNAWTFPEEEALLGSSEGCAPLDPPFPNVLQVGSNWRLAQMVDGYHLSVSARQPEGTSGNGAQTAMIYAAAGRAHGGPRVDYNAWGEVPTYSDSPPRFGARTLEIDRWRIRQIDDAHLSVTHENGNVARIYRSDGTVHGMVNGFSGYRTPALGDPTCAFLTERFVQLGDWRLGEIGDHLSVGHRGGKTSFIYRRDGTTYPGPRTDYNPWNFAIGAILRGSAGGCASISDASFVPFESGASPAKVVVEFNRALPAAAGGVEDSFKVRDAANATSELDIASSILKNRGSTLELVLASAPSPGVSYRVSAVDDVPTGDPAETVAAGSAFDIAVTSWDYLQVGNWRLARTCETCSRSHLSISSDNALTSQIFTEAGTTHPGPRSDYNGWDRASLSGPTYSASGVRFGDFGIQVRDWRVRQIDKNHLSVTHEDGNVARIYRSDGTVHGTVNGFSGYRTALGEPACAYLTATYLQVGDWRFGVFDGSHFSVSHRLGMTSMIYRTDGTIHPGPRTSHNTWTFPEREALLGSKEGCETSPLFA
eukprot:CAMPEP_0172573246 /NCGR_PEP_ID=MMETSP1067-20121228/136090_1 /TAXON_ID=265564 ORGANISM="Thalassiosira punctigera, Strain Tpunct2005C2" /NCGR_SAMPLE_ID=MMETSP1067 /ASSEMBLY_ACC=CAM_ASM_000444 /LENGTH=1253 /DNA_ID=CAMNT_0013365843 /DNA_START=80 /DNA_END=3841 /DNA_ORIENTATION=-